MMKKEKIRKGEREKEKRGKRKIWIEEELDE